MKMIPETKVLKFTNKVFIVVHAGGQVMTPTQGNGQGQGTTSAPMQGQAGAMNAPQGGGQQAGAQTAAGECYIS